MCGMRSATIREVQHNLSKVLREVEAGQTVEIVRRKQPVARLTPAVMATGTMGSVDWENHEARMTPVWKGVVIDGVDEVLDEMRGGR